MVKNISKELSLGIERHIDDLERIVIPKEMRNKLNFEQNEVVSIKLFDDHIEIKSDSDIGVANSGGENTPQISAGWLPEGFVLVDEGQSAIMSWQSYAIDGTVAQISINSWNLQSGGVSFDTETAEILPIQIHGQTAFLIEDADTLQIAWNLYGDNGWLYYVAGQGVTTDELIKVAEATKIC